MFVVMLALLLSGPSGLLLRADAQQEVVPGHEDLIKGEKIDARTCCTRARTCPLRLPSRATRALVLPP